MKVKMKVMTNYQGTHLKRGDEFNVDDATAKRWFRLRLAEPLDPADAEDVTPEKPTAKELYQKCKSLGIKGIKQKQKPEYYEKLIADFEADQTAEEEATDEVEEDAVEEE